MNVKAYTLRGKLKDYGDNNMQTTKQNTNIIKNTIGGIEEIYFGSDSRCKLSFGFFMLGF